MALVLRAVFAVAVVALCIYLLQDGKPLGPLFVIPAALWLRRGIESGRIQARLRTIR